MSICTNYLWINLKCGRVTTSGYTKDDHIFIEVERAGGNANMVRPDRAVLSINGFKRAAQECRANGYSRVVDSPSGSGLTMRLERDKVTMEIYCTRESAALDDAHSNPPLPVNLPRHVIEPIHLTIKEFRYDLDMPWAPWQLIKPPVEICVAGGMTVLECHAQEMAYDERCEPGAHCSDRHHFLVSRGPDGICAWWHSLRKLKPTEFESAPLISIRPERGDLVIAGRNVIPCTFSASMGPARRSKRLRFNQAH
jgi:hypothetical protein